MGDDYIDKFRDMVIEQTIGKPKETGAKGDAQPAMLEEVMRVREQEIADGNKEKDKIAEKIITKKSVNMVQGLMGHLLR